MFLNGCFWYRYHFFQKQCDIYLKKLHKYKMNHSTVEELMALAQNEVPSQIESYHGLIRPILSSGPSAFIDVHRFDYSYVNKTHETVNETPEQRHILIQQLMDRMSNPIAKQGAHIILANIGHDANKDSTNQKTADDLLVLLAKHVEKDPSFLPMIEEQLQDMVQLGQCAQGRTTRLWQLYQALQ